MARLSPAELADGWRLACGIRPDSDITLDLAQWETSVLSDNSQFHFEPRPGLGVAIDLGTTTIVAQLLDLQTGSVLGVQAALNAQARHGADVMSRIEFALRDQGQHVLEALVRDQIGTMLNQLLDISPAAVGASCDRVVLVGNTVMHHLFSGQDVEPLSHYPFEPGSTGLQRFRSNDLGWTVPGNPEVYFLPCLGGFVGSDILAGILATRLHERDSLAVLIDLGTNGEIVVGNREGLVCAATAAGPAFEGACISMGMRAATGAISEVRVLSHTLECRVLGGTTARGICGSGLVDAVAAGLELGAVLPNGRLANGKPLELQPPVKLNQADIRELQLAKGAIAAGIRLLLEDRGASVGEVTQVFLAGAFGNYISQENARRIGLFEFPPAVMLAAGNTALLGAKLALFQADPEKLCYPAIRERTRHLSLNERPGFEEVYAEAMGFPESGHKLRSL